jgi:predicted Zn-dependent protease
MLRIAETDHELAVVMGHEIAHVVAKHGNERMSQGLLMEVVGSSLEKLSDGEDEGTRRLVLTAFGLGANLGYMLPFSRLSEREADQIGLLYSARAGYDPRASIEFWEKMARQGGGSPPAFLSTHPNYEKRIEGLNELMPRALEEYRKAGGEIPD